MNLDVTSQNETRNDVWNELYEICWNLCVKGQWDGIRFKDVVEKARGSDDRKLVEFLVWLSNYRKKINYNDKFEWTTSCVFQRKYPPVTCDMVVEPWNQFSSPFYLSSFNPEIREWTNLKQTRLDPSVIVQDSFLNDCSLICSLLNAKRKNLIKRVNCENFLHFNFYFNGSKRLVSIPKNVLVPKNFSTSKPISLASSDLDDQLLELAYFELKNNRFYNYNGSNTASDSFLLTGWIPEVLETSSPDVLNQVKKFWEADSMIAIGTDQSAETSEINYHDYVVLDIDWENKHWKILNPQYPDSVLEYTSTEVTKRFRWIYVNWNAESKYLYHFKFHCRYMDEFNNYASWTQKPVIRIENNSRIRQNILVLMERHLLETPDEGYSIVFGELPSSGFTAVEAAGNNLGFYNLKTTLEAFESRLFFYHSDIKANITFHLFGNSSDLKIIRGKSPVYTLHSRWDVSNNQYHLNSSTYFKNPVFRLDVHDTHEGYLDLELTSKDPAKVNLQVFRSNDYSLQKPLLKDIEYHPNSTSLHGLVVTPGISYNIICSVSEQVESDFILTARSSSDQLHFSLNPTCLGYGGLLFQTSIITSRKIRLMIDSFTNLFISVYSNKELYVRPSFFTIYEEETFDIISAECQFSEDLKKNPLVFSNINLRSGNYILAFQNNGHILNVNIGSSCKIQYSIQAE